MEKADVILIGGIVFSCVWLLAYSLFSDRKKKTITLLVGIVVDIILYLMCRRSDFLLAGLIGGLVIGLIPGLGSLRKRKKAVKESGGTMHFTFLMIVFVTMIFLIVAAAYPNVIIAG